VEQLDRDPTSIAKHRVWPSSGGDRARGAVKLGRRSSLGGGQVWEAAELGASSSCASEYVEELYSSGGLACREEPRGFLRKYTPSHMSQRQEGMPHYANEGGFPTIF
jgi:hypothetical protein